MNGFEVTGDALKGAIMSVRLTRMNYLIFFFFVSMVMSSELIVAEEGTWITLFDGKTLDGWEGSGWR